MTSAIFLPWLGLVALAAILAILAIWARRETRIRIAAVAMFLAAAPASLGALWLSLGWPVPIITGVTAMPGEYLVLGSKMIAGDGIYVLIDAGGSVPRYYRIPWSKGIADRLQDLLDGGGAGVIMKLPSHERSWDQSPPQFWALPQPKALPDKLPGEPGPRFVPDREA